MDVLKDVTTTLCWPDTMSTLQNNRKYDLSGSSLTSTVSESVLQNSVWFAPSSELCALTMSHMIWFCMLYFVYFLFLFYLIYMTTYIKYDLFICLFNLYSDSFGGYEMNILLIFFKRGETP